MLERNSELSYPTTSVVSYNKVVVNGSFPASAGAKSNFIVCIVKVLFVIVPSTWIAFSAFNLLINIALRAAFAHIESFAGHDC